LKDVIGRDYTRYFTIGDGGNREGLSKNWTDIGPWSAFHNSTFGYARFDMYNHTHLHFSWISDERETNRTFGLHGTATQMVQYFPQSRPNFDE
jgi:hypothetical protein